VCVCVCVCVYTHYSCDADKEVLTSYQSCF